MFRPQLRLLVVAALVILGSASMAFAQEATPFTSAKGYSITPPAGWESVVGELGEEELAKLPPTVRDHYNPKETDVLFMDAAPAKDTDFRDNLNVFVLDEPVPISPELLEEIKGVLTEQYRSLFDSFQLVAFETAKYGENDAIRIEATYTLVGLNLVLYQALMSGPTKAVIVTCTLDSARKADREKFCTDAFASVKFE
ncbi:MAG: hypothetical protein RBU37_13350 [Myxococcota bacterium]|jgi:hypothetical protein|nr:hypothetical protein [Myxococcota bacterium]